MAEGVCRNGYLWEVTELLLQEVRPQLVVIYDVVVVGTGLIVLHVATAEDLPVLGLEELFDGVLPLNTLLLVPPLEEAHFAVHECPPSLLMHLAVFLPEILAGVEHIHRRVEYVLYRGEPVLLEVPDHVAARRLRVVVVFEVEDPEGVQMGVHCHVQSVGFDVRVQGVRLAMIVKVGLVTRVITDL